MCASLSLSSSTSGTTSSCFDWGFDEKCSHPIFDEKLSLWINRGYRLLAMSVVPIGGNTLIYGSSDAGLTVHADNDQFNEVMRRAANYLGLKAHLVGSGEMKTIYGPTDIEGIIPGEVSSLANERAKGIWDMTASSTSSTPPVRIPFLHR